MNEEIKKIVDFLDSIEDSNDLELLYKLLKLKYSDKIIGSYISKDTTTVIL